jgi:hypothetical protein
VKLPAIISDHMVLQRDREHALWGLADPGAQVTARIAGEERTPGQVLRANGRCGCRA